MKILKKIGLIAIILVVCLASSFQYVNAYNEQLAFTKQGPSLSTNIGSIDLTVAGRDGTEIAVPVSTTFWDSFPNELVLDGDINLDYYNFTHSKNNAGLFCNQDYGFQRSGIYDIQLVFTDIYLQDLDYQLPRITFDINYINAEQNFSYSWSANYYDIDLGYNVDVEEDFEKNMLTTDNRIWTMDLSTEIRDAFFVDQESNPIIHINKLVLNIGHNDSFNSSYETILAINDMKLDTNYYYTVQSDFISNIRGIHSNSLFNWLTSSISSFMDTDIFPNFNLGTLLGVIVAVPLLMYILKLFLGG